MITAKLIDNVWATRKAESLNGYKLMLAEVIGGNSAGERMIVVDIISAGIGDRVVVPGRQTEFVRIIHPGIRATALADNRAFVWTGDYIDPRCRRTFTRFQSNDIPAPIGRKSAQAVVKYPFARWQRTDRFRDR